MRKLGAILFFAGVTALVIAVTIKMMSELGVLGALFSVGFGLLVIGGLLCCLADYSRL